MFTYVIEPQRNATFMARYASLLSAAQTLWVRPAVQLRRVSPSLFEVDVSAGGGSYFSKNVVLERYDSGHRRWRTVALNRLKESSPPDALIAVSSTRIKAAVPSGTKLRATAAQSAVGGCYRAAHSPAITG
jgi:hypothetical protein